MNILKLENFSNLAYLKEKINFLLQKNDYVIIDFLDSKNFTEVYNFLKLNFLKNKIKIKNLPFCLNNFYFENLENKYKYSYLPECSYCNFGINCKGVNNFNFKPIILKTKNSELYRKKILFGIKLIQNFLIGLGYKENEIIFGVDKHAMLYYFLFKKYDIFFNGGTNSYFRDSNTNMILILLKNINLNKKYFSNNGRNLLFKNKFLLEKYIKIMDMLKLDIVFCHGEKNGKITKKENIYFFYNYFLLQKFFKKVNNKNKNQNIDLKEFYFKKFINNSKKEKITGEIVNINEKNLKISENFILVGIDTTPRFLELIIKSDCILLERNNDLSHGVIISRELKKDCIYGVNGISSLKTGEKVEIDFKNNIIKKL